MRLRNILIHTSWAFLFCSGAVLASVEQTATPSGSVRAPGSTKPPAVVPRSNLTFACPSGKSFKISTGSDSGSCQIQTNSDGKITGGKCVIGGSQVALVVCGGSEGGTCDSTAGSGSCSPVN